MIDYSVTISTMKKILSCLSIIGFYTFYISGVYAENINDINYQNLDKIEITWYYHPALVSPGDALGWWLWDIRFNQGTQWKSLFSYPELQPFLNNVEIFKDIHWQTVFIGALNNIPPTYDQEADWDWYYNDGINKTGSWEFLLIPSKSFSWNVMKNPIFKDAHDINGIPWLLNYSKLTEYFKKNKVKIIWRFYHIQWKYDIEEKNSWKINLDLNWNIILVDDISLDLKAKTPISKEKTREELIKEKAKVYENKIDKIIDNIPMFTDKIDKINLFIKALSIPKYKNNPIVKELLEYLKNIESKLDENLNLNTLFGF